MSRRAGPSTDSKDRAHGAEADRRSRIVRGLEIAIVGLGFLFVLVAGIGIYLYSISRSLPDLDVRSASFKVPRTSTVYAADGTVLAEWHGEQDRHVVGLEDIAKPMRDAAVAIEDARFYEHDGVDWEAIVRAGRADSGRGADTRGGSTITHQLVRLLITKGDRTLGRKVRETLLAYELETKSDKGSVLETYLNIVYFGHGAYGVESAARTYFGKPASELTVPEAALLAGLIRSPARYSPTASPAIAKKRRDVVLAMMREQGYISADQEAESARSKVSTSMARAAPQIAPYFVEYVKQDLVSRLGTDLVNNGGLQVHTTLDTAMQRSAEAAVRRILPAPADPDVAVVTIEPKTGRVIAMIGGRDFRKDKFNLAVQGRRQPGSAFKPFVLVTALEQGVSPDQVFDARPYTVGVKDGVWRVDNYENAATAPSVTLRAATAWSVNCVYARLVMQVGPDKVVRTAKAMGITTPLDANPAIALGGLRFGVSPLEMANAYATLANGGTRVRPSGVDTVTDLRGKVVYRPMGKAERAIPAAVAETASQMLHEVVERGTGTSARMGRWAAGKTGTTQSYRDAWFVGWTDDLTTAVWVGYAKGQVPMLNVHGIKVTGGSFPALIWNGAMAQAQPRSQQAAGGNGGIPELVLVRLCTDTMLLANPRCPNVIEMYLPTGRAPASVCTKH
ncbi:MAG TPA: PBP1A family penicillin-binding protein [Coriobacteriia bacterium]